VKVEKISDTYVASIDTEKREVCLEDGEAAYRYNDDSIVALLLKAMTRKATFIIKDQLVSWVELETEVRARSR
jgi:hypothetical protein